MSNSLYFRVKEGTQAYELFEREQRNLENYVKHEPEIREKLGCNVYENIAMVTSQLCICNPPKHLKSQFSKKRFSGSYRALKDSEINQWWVKFCIKNGLKEFGFDDIAVGLGFVFKYSSFDRDHYKGQYILGVVCGDYDSNFWTTRDYLEPLKKSEYYQIKADQEREREAAKQ